MWQTKLLSAKIWGGIGGRAQEMTVAPTSVGYLKLMAPLQNQRKDPGIIFKLL